MGIDLVREELDYAKKNLNGESGQAEGNKLNDARRESDITKDEIKRLGSSLDLLLTLCLLIIPTTLFFLGNKYWEDRFYVPDEGLGYWLGLVGGSMMLIAYGYTLFKYFNVFRSRVVMKYWLTIHIAFGLLGPLLVMFHSTFRLGSLNAAVALIAMILMFYSGVIARFLYAKTHNKLDGKKTKAKDLQNMLMIAGRSINSDRMNQFSESVLSQRESLFAALWQFATFGWRAQILYFKVSSDLLYHLRVMAQENGWNHAIVKQKKREFQRQLREYIATLKKVSLFYLYERFFLFWRNAHVPLAWLLFMSGIVHVVAVHMY